MAVAVVPPVRSVTEDQHAAFAFALAQRGTVRRAIGEQERIARFEVDFFRALDPV